MAMQTVPAATLHRLDTEAYNRMVASGILGDRPVELIEGLLVERMPPGPEHTATIARLLRHLAGARAWLFVQLPLEVLPDSEPQPDLALVEQEPSPKQHARSALLAVEVAVSSHKLDRGEKARLYARAGVPVYWLVDVPASSVEVYSHPEADRYRECRVYGPTARVPSSASGVDDLDVAALFEGFDD